MLSPVPAILLCVLLHYSEMPASSGEDLAGCTLQVQDLLQNDTAFELPTVTSCRDLAIGIIFDLQTYFSPLISVVANSKGRKTSKVLFNDVK